MIKDIIKLIKTNEDLARLNRGELTAREKAQAEKISGVIDINKIIANISAIAK